MPIASHSIRTRILAAFVLSLAAFTAALTYGLVQLRNIGEGLIVLDEGYLPLANVSAQLDAIARQMDRDHDRFARESPRPVAGHRSNASFYSTNLSEAVRRGHSTVGRASSHITSLEEQAVMEELAAILDEIDTLRIDHHQAVEHWLDTHAPQVSEADSATTTDENNPLTRALPPQSARALAALDTQRTELVLKVNELSQLIEGRIQRLSARTAQAQTRALTVSGTLSLLAILLAGVMAAVALITLRPIGLLTAQVQRLAAGDVAGRVDVRADDEIGLLAREFNAMAQAVVERDRRLKERAEVLDRLSLYLRRVLDTIQAGIVVVQENNAVMVNPAATHLWSAREGQVLPEPLTALAHGRYKAISFGAQLLDIDVVPFGEQGTLIVGEDVTERIHDQQRLARSERLAMVGQMLAQITHEVRNPLNAMSLNAELLAEDLERGEQRTLMTTITDEISRLEQITGRYLELSRRRRAELTAADPVELLKDVLRVEEAALQQAGVHHILTENARGVVEFDADALRRALRNVILNAVQAGAQVISIKVERDVDTISVEISDDGPGMAPLEVKRVFEPFFTTKTRGTGLGLAISRQELEDVGGTIHCISTTTGGSTFALTIPFTA